MTPVLPAFDDSLSAVRFQSRPQAVAEKLRHSILTGLLKPGDRLIEQKLAAHFGIGQPTIREALKDLELQGFVRKTSRNHTCVTKLSGDDFEKILEIRLALEALAVARATNRFTPEAGEELEARLEAMAAAAGQPDIVAYYESDMLFHRRIWDLASNQHLGTSLERIALGLFAFALLENRGASEALFGASVEQHRRILNALRSGDPAIARKVFLESTAAFWSDYYGIALAAV